MNPDLVDLSTIRVNSDCVGFDRGACRGWVGVHHGGVRTYFPCETCVFVRTCVRVRMYIVRMLSVPTYICARPVF